MSLTPESQRSRLLAFLERLQSERYFGQVTLHIQSGNITAVKTQRSWKLEGLDEPTQQDAQAD